MWDNKAKSLLSLNAKKNHFAHCCCTAHMQTLKSNKPVTEKKKKGKKKDPVLAENEKKIAEEQALKNHKEGVFSYLWE